MAIAGASCLSLTAVFTKLADTTTATAVFYRCLIALIPLAGLAWREVRRNGGPTRRTVYLHMVGGSLLGVDFALWTHAITLVGAGIATILNSAQVVVVPLLAWLIYRERIQLRFVVALPLMLAAIAAASGAFDSGPGTGSNPLLGSVLGLASGVAYAGYLFIIGRTNPSTSTSTSDGAGSGAGPNVQVFVSTAAAGVVGVVIASVWGKVDFAPGLASFGWLVSLALLGQVVGWLLIGKALPALTAQVGPSLLLLQPALGIVFAMVMVHERPTLVQFIGCVAVIALVGLVSRTTDPAQQLCESADSEISAPTVLASPPLPRAR